MQILFVTSNRLGDAVLSTGLLDHLIKLHPDARFTIVCGPVAEGLFARMPNRERTIVLRKQSHGRHWLPLWAAAAPRLWDLVVDIRGSALAWLVPTKRRAIFRRTGGAKIAELAAMLGVSPPPLPVAWIDELDRSFVGGLVPADRPVLALAPTANWQPKVWPAERFAALAGAFPALTPAILGGPGAQEHAMAAPLLAALPHAIDLVGRLTLPQVSAALERAALFVGNDSGLMHMAAAAGAPTIGLFGPTDAATYAPAGPRAIAVKAASMAGITVGQVVTAASSMLKESATSRPVVSSTRSALA